DVDDGSALAIERISILIESNHFDDELAALTSVFGTPGILDAGKWAQFDPPGGRVCLAPSDTQDSSVAMMINVGSLTETVVRLRQLGWSVKPVIRGEHEERVEVMTPQGRRLIAYRPF